MMACVDSNSRTLTATFYFSLVLAHERNSNWDSISPSFSRTGPVGRTRLHRIAKPVRPVPRTVSELGLPRRRAPFVEAGPSFRVDGNLNGYNPSHYGATRPLAPSPRDVSPRSPAPSLY